MANGALGVIGSSVRPRVELLVSPESEVAMTQLQSTAGKHAMVGIYSTTTASSLSVKVSLDSACNCFDTNASMPFTVLY